MAKLYSILLILLSPILLIAFILVSPFYVFYKSVERLSLYMD